MKKTLLLGLIIFGATSFSILAEDANYDAANTNLGVPTRICTIVSEKFFDEKGICTQVSSNPLRYQCCVSSKTGFTDFIASIYKYIFFISLVLGVLFMVVLGIGISISGFDEGKIKEKAKTQLIATLIGIIALALIPWILKTVAPFIFQ